MTPGNVALVNQKWHNLVKQENALDRTIGVVTKSDTIQKGDHEPVRTIYMLCLFFSF
jgi:hypothetical protein